MSVLDVLRRSFRRYIRYAGPASRPGVYLLLADERVAYVGSSVEIDRRMTDHEQSRRSGDLRFDVALWMRAWGEDRLFYEGALIRALHPRLNKSSPSLKSVDIGNELLASLGLGRHVPGTDIARAWRDSLMLRRTGS